MKKFILHIILIFCFSTAIAQSGVHKENIKRKYESFEYSDVIRYVDIYLYNNVNISKSDSIEVLTMKGVSQYSLGKETEAKESFNQILMIEYQHRLNPVAVSPKIIDLFEDVKKDFKVMPGWGHIYLGENTKGWLLTGLSAATLGTMIYYIIDTQTKEQNYLNETNPALIEDKYNDYNKSYKVRNTLIVGYAILWIYSQTDLLFNSDDLFENKIKITLTSKNNELLPESYNLNIQFALD